MSKLREYLKLDPTMEDPLFVHSDPHAFEGQGSSEWVRLDALTFKMCDADHLDDHVISRCKDLGFYIRADGIGIMEGLALCQNMIASHTLRGKGNVAFCGSSVHGLIRDRYRECGLVSVEDETLPSNIGIVMFQETRKIWKTTSIPVVKVGSYIMTMPDHPLINDGISYFSVLEIVE